MEIFTASGFAVLMQVIAMDLVLAGDNAVVIGLAAAGLPAHQRPKAILIGIIAATVLRIGLALIATKLLGIPGVVFVGGLLLSWVVYKMFMELQAGHGEEHHADGVPKPARQKTLGQAALQIVIADISMSLDNVIAVAGAAREHPTVLIIGLVFSIALMGLAATFIARLLDKHRWIAYLGLAIIAYVAVSMLWEGGHQLLTMYQAHQPAT